VDISRTLATVPHGRTTSVANRHLAVAITVVQAHVFIRLREMAERRPELAQPDRAVVSLSNATTANVDWLVCESIAVVVSTKFLRHPVRNRTRRAVFNFCTTAVTVFGRGAIRDLANPDFATGQLAIFKPF